MDNGANNERRKCQLCHHFGGALSEINGGKAWVHTCCAIYIPEIYFVEGGYAEIGAIKRQRFGQQCYACNLPKGAVIKCSVASCNNHFHVHCGVRNKWLIEPIHHPAPESDIFYAHYCDQHSHEMDTLTDDEKFIFTYSGQLLVVKGELRKPTKKQQVQVRVKVLQPKKKNKSKNKQKRGITKDGENDNENEPEEEQEQDEYDDIEEDDDEQEEIEELRTEFIDVVDDSADLQICAPSDFPQAIRVSDIPELKRAAKLGTRTKPVPYKNYDNPSQSLQNALRNPGGLVDLSVSDDGLLIRTQRRRSEGALAVALLTRLGPDGEPLRRGRKRKTNGDEKFSKDDSNNNKKDDDNEDEDVDDEEQDGLEGTIKKQKQKRTRPTKSFVDDYVSGSDLGLDPDEDPDKHSSSTPNTSTQKRRGRKTNASRNNYLDPDAEAGVGASVKKGIKRRRTEDEYNDDNEQQINDANDDDANINNNIDDGYADGQDNDLNSTAQKKKTKTVSRAKSGGRGRGRGNKRKTNTSERNAEKTPQSNKFASRQSSNSNSQQNLPRSQATPHSTGTDGSGNIYTRRPQVSQYNQQQQQQSPYDQMSMNQINQVQQQQQQQQQLQNSQQIRRNPNAGLPGPLQLQSAFEPALNPQQVGLPPINAGDQASNITFPQLMPQVTVAYQYPGYGMMGQQMQ
ncbi:MAG: hypothetical protein EZS28_035317, partial [Streblomastix strix]